MLHLIAPSSVLRERPAGHHVVVGPIELFFDLVYVFTIIQLSHSLLADLTWTGAAEFAVLFLAMWWAWNYSAWAMNWLEPESGQVQGLLGVLMLCALSMAVALPEAFGDRGLWFALSYVALQVIRSVYCVIALRGRDDVMARNFSHLLAWSLFAAPFWIAGAFVDDGARVALWVVAVVVDYVAPWTNYAVPGAGNTPMSTWSLRPEHLAERTELVFIIALGESILIMGGTLLSHDPTGASIVAAVLGFVLLLLLWWHYFNPRIHPSDTVDAAAAGRSAFAYAHALMVSGAIVLAVGLELVIAHPTGHLSAPTVTTLFVGPTLFLVGSIWLRTAQRVGDNTERAVAAAVLVVLGVILYAARDSAAPLLAVAAPIVVLAALSVVTLRTRSTASH